MISLFGSRAGTLKLKSQLRMPMIGRLFSSTEEIVMYSWGIGTDGQLGHGKFSLKNGVMGESYVQAEPRKLLRSKRFTKAFVGESCSMFLTGDGQVFGCGEGLVGFSTDAKTIKEPILLNFSDPIVDISLGQKHAAVIDNKGKVFVWGDNGSWFRGGGQLGLGHRNDVSKPTLVSYLSEDLASKVTAVQCADRHTLFLLDDGDLFAAGLGEYGRLGTGDAVDCLVPTPVNMDLLGEDDVITGISAGADHSLAVTKNGKVLSWGRNQSGQLGHGDSYMDIYSMEDIPRSVEIPDLPKDHKIISVAAGHSRSVCVSDHGDVWTWGARLSHQPAKIDRSAVFKGEKVTKAILGGDSSRSAIFFLLESGALYVKGDVSSDMLGKADSNRMSKISVPEAILFFQNMQVVDIFAGRGQHVFARVKAPQV